VGCGSSASAVLKLALRFTTSQGDSPETWEGFEGNEINIRSVDGPRCESRSRRCSSRTVNTSKVVVECVWNVMAHTQKPDFVFRRNGRVHLHRRGASVRSTTSIRGVRISGSNAGYTMFRGSVKSTGYPLKSPVSPSFPLPCVSVCHHISTGLYVTTKIHGITFRKTILTKPWKQLYFCRINPSGNEYHATLRDIWFKSGSDSFCSSSGVQPDWHNNSTPEVYVYICLYMYEVQNLNVGQDIS
jgi:hypothetical protein